MEMEFKTEDDLGIVEMSGDLNVVRVDPFRRKFKDWYLANPNVKNVIVDLSGIAMIDSAGLGALVALLKQVGEREGSLCLAGLKKRVRLVFEITRTHRIFDIYDNVKEAKNALG